MGISEGMSPALPEDMLIRIFAALEVPDLVRAGSVCSSWCSAYTSICNLGLPIRQQTPCLLYTSESAGDSAAGLYSLAEQKAYTVKLPDPPIRSRHLVGSSYGWIITADERSELSLVNPITAEHVALPSVTTIEQVKPVLDDAGALRKYEYYWSDGKKTYYPPSIFALNDLRDYLFFKAVLSSDPCTGHYVVALIHNPRWQLSFARAGDDRWTWLPPCKNYEDCFFKDGLLYALTKKGEIQVFDLSGPSVTCTILIDGVKDHIYENMYIVPAPCGDLLQVWRTCHTPGEYEEDDDDPEQEPDPESSVLSTTVIQVHRVDTLHKKLVETSSLGRHVLFLGHNLSLCLNAEEYPQLNANHVYFTDDQEDWNLAFKNSTRDIGVYSLENNSRDSIISPQLWSNWPRPVWIIPNPRRMNMALFK